MAEKSTLFPRTFIGVILLVQKSMLFPGTFFDVICLVENMHVVFTYFSRRNFDGQKFDIVFGKL